LSEGKTLVFEDATSVLLFSDKFPLESRPQILYNDYASTPLYPTNVRKGAAMDMIKVSATSRTSAVAGAIAGVVREHKRAEVQAIGAGAVNQAVKALALATGYLRIDGINVVCMPEFVDVDIEGNIRTAIKLVIEPR
jgi:stage V sporulation protein S